MSYLSVQLSDYEHLHCAITVLDRGSYSGGPWLDSRPDQPPKPSVCVVFSPVIEMLDYSHAPHNDVSVNDGPRIRRWYRKLYYIIYYIILYYIILYYIILYYVMLCCVVLCCVVLCCVVLYYIILYYIILYYIILYYINTIVLQLPTIFNTVTCCTGL